MGLKECANCGNAIGNLEQSFMLQTQSICKDCKAFLDGQEKLLQEENLSVRVGDAPTTNSMATDDSPKYYPETSFFSYNGRINRSKYLPCSSG